MKKERNTEICRMYAEGATLRAIAEKHGFTYQRTHQILIANGVTLRKRGAPLRTRFPNKLGIEKPVILRPSPKRQAIIDLARRHADRSPS